MTVEPGQVCESCGRRVNKPKLPTSPDTKVVSIGRLPLERQAALADALRALAVYTGAVDHSYPAGSLLEVLVLLGGQQREEIKTYFDREQA